MEVIGFILILLVGNSIAYRDSNYGTRERSLIPTGDYECLKEGIWCTSCNSALFCGRPGADPISVYCGENKICLGDPPFGPNYTAGCVSYLDSSGLDGRGLDCDCTNIGNRGYLTDPYDPTKYVECIPPEYQYFRSCPKGEQFSDETKSCIPITTTLSPKGCDCEVDCITTSDDLTHADPTCQTFVLSFDTNLPPVTLSCPEGEAFDISKLQCVPVCDLAPPPFSCPEIGAGAFPDTVDCTIFHVCSGGQLIVSGISCPDGGLFEPLTQMCRSAATSSGEFCPKINPCWLAHCDACFGKCPSHLY